MQMHQIVGPTETDQISTYWIILYVTEFYLSLCQYQFIHVFLVFFLEFI